MSQKSAIHWPQECLPGLTDNFVSNEIIVKDLSVAELWPYLVNTKAWPTCYANVSNITFHDSADADAQILKDKTQFAFSTFGFPPLAAQVVEYVAPSSSSDDHQVARLSWTAKRDGPPSEKLDVLHAWLLEDLSHNRVRVLTQESQIGELAKQLAAQKPNPLLNAHQDWLDGLHAIALKNKN